MTEGEQVARWRLCAPSASQQRAARGERGTEKLKDVTCTSKEGAPCRLTGLLCKGDLRQLQQFVPRRVLGRAFGLKNQRTGVFDPASRLRSRRKSVLKREVGRLKAAVPVFVARADD